MRQKNLRILHSTKSSSSISRVAADNDNNFSCINLTILVYRQILNQIIIMFQFADGL